MGYGSRKWHNVPGSVQISTEDMEHPEINVIEDEYVEVDFVSSGYYDCGKTYGDPFYCYPPEGEDERIIKNVTIYTLDGEERPGTKELASYLDTFYRKEIDGAEIDEED